MKTFLRGVAFVIYVVVACAVGGEIVVRGLYDSFRNYNMEMWRYASDLKKPLDRENLPFHHWPNKRGTYYGAEIATNSLGFRDGGVEAPKPSDEQRVVFIGDSFTLGWGVESDETFSSELERLLNRGAGGYRTINMGVGNYNTIMEVELFKWKGLELDPDLVILMYFVNDVEAVPARKSALGYALVKHSYFSAFLFDRFTRLRSRLMEARRWNEYYAALYSSENAGNVEANAKSTNELIALCGQRGTGLLIVSIPDLHQLEDYPFTYATEHIRALAEAGGVPFLDLRPALAGYEPQTLWVSPEDHHANVMANGVIAEQIYGTIQSEGLLH